MKSNTNQAFWLGIGNFFSFGIMFCILGILSRVLSKTDYGTYRQIFYIYNTFLLVFSVGLPKSFSYFLPQVNLEERSDLVRKINVVLFSAGLFISVFLFFGADFISIVLNNKEVIIPLKCFSLVPVLMLPTLGLEAILSSYRETKLVAFYLFVTKSIQLVCVALPLLLCKPTVLVAVMGITISSFLSCIIALYVKGIPYRHVVSVKSSIQYKDIIQYSLPLTLAGIAGIGINAADQFFISRFWGADVFADFSNGSLQIPIVGMMTAATGGVLMPLFTEMLTKGEDRKNILGIWKRTFLKSAMIIYPIVAFCIVFASTIIVFVFGQEYETSAIYFQIMSIANFFNIILFSPILLAMGAIRFYQNVHIILMLSVWLFEYISVLVIQSPVAITIISMLGIVAKVITFLYFISRKMGVSIIELIPQKEISYLMLLSMILLSIESFLFNRYLPDMQCFLKLFWAFAIYIICFVCISEKIGLRYRELLKPLLTKFVK